MDQLQQETRYFRQIITSKIDILYHTGIIRKLCKNNYIVAGKMYRDWFLENFTFEFDAESAGSPENTESVTFLITAEIYDPILKHKVVAENDNFSIKKGKNYKIKFTIFTEKPHQKIDFYEFEIPNSLIQNDPTISMEFEDIFGALDISEKNRILNLPQQNEMMTSREISIIPQKSGEFPIYINLWRIEKVCIISLKLRVEDYE